MEKSDNKSKGAQYSLLNNLNFLLQASLKQNKFIVPGIIVLSILQALLPIISIYLSKTTIDLLTDSLIDVPKLIQFIILVIMVIWVFKISINALEKWIAMYANRNRHYLLQMIENKILNMDYVNLGEPSIQRSRRKAIQSINSNLSGGEAIFTNGGLLLQHVIDLVFYSLFITSLNIYIFVFLVLSYIFITLFMRKAQVFESEQKIEESKIEQRLNYVREKQIKYESAKELRLFSMLSWFSNYLCENTELALGIRRKVYSNYFKVDVVSDLLGFLRDGIAYAF